MSDDDSYDDDDDIDNRAMRPKTFTYLVSMGT